MKFFETSKYHFFKKSTYISLRWIGIIGQLISVNFVYFLLNFDFNFIICNLVIFLGVLSNLFLIFIYKKTQLSDRSAFIFLVIDILQLGTLLYLTGGITKPFVIFLLVPSIFSSSNLSLRTNTLLVLLTIITILFLTFYYHDLPLPIKSDLHNNHYYYYSIPTALVIALIFLNYLAMSFGTQSRVRREALAKMEEVMASEHELLSLGGQAAAAAHSLGTPLSTIKIIAHDLEKQFQDQHDVKKDEFIDKDLSMKDYLSEIISSFKEISQKKFIFNYDQFSNQKKITKSIEILYGLRNFIGNANKFSNETIHITLKSDSEITEITIQDDGNGYPKDVLSKIGEPYLRTKDPIDKPKAGLGLGLFIGKTLLEKNFASINCRNSKTRGGAEVIIKWNNKDLFNI